jgi:hypothetical protein
VGADAEAPLSYREADLRGPLALVVGSEGQGVSGPIRRRLDLAISIPMTGRVASLNAAVAGSVLLVEASAQRGLPRRPAAGAPTESGARRAAEREAPPQDAASEEPPPPELAPAEVGAPVRARRAKGTAKARAGGNATKRKRAGTPEGAAATTEGDREAPPLPAVADEAPPSAPAVANDAPPPAAAVVDEASPPAPADGAPEPGPTATTDADLLPD